MFRFWLNQKSFQVNRRRQCMSLPRTLSRRPLLLCSIGNPQARFAFTRHNAGHIMLDVYKTAMRFPDFTQDPSIRGLTSVQGEITLFHSNVYMNRSGVAIAQAYTQFKAQKPDGLLCVIHDDLEAKAGTVKLKLAGQGRGHRGIRSCINHLGTDKFARISIGISRPDSRDPEVVSDWVLGKFTGSEIQYFEEECLFGMYAALKALHEASSRGEWKLLNLQEDVYWLINRFI